MLTYMYMRQHGRSMYIKAALLLNPCSSSCFSHHVYTGFVLSHSSVVIFFFFLLFLLFYLPLLFFLQCCNVSQHSRCRCRTSHSRGPFLLYLRPLRLCCFCYSELRLDGTLSFHCSLCSCSERQFSSERAAN